MNEQNDEFDFFYRMCNGNFSGQNFDMLMLQVIEVMRQLKILLAGPIDGYYDLLPKSI